MGKQAVCVGAAVVVLMLVCACGGGSSSDVTTAGDKTFEGDGYSFSYPGGWVERDLEQASGGGGGVDIGPADGPSGMTFTSEPARSTSR
jgi:hypothetical protein